MLIIKFILILFFISFILYEIYYNLTLKYQQCNSFDNLIRININNIIDSLIVVYVIIIILIIISYNKNKRNKKKLNIFYNNNQNNNYNKKLNIITSENWKEKLDGIWQQFKAEGLEEFGELTEPSAMRRTLGAIAFFKVRHTITIKDGYFNLQRDLGMSVSVWNLRALIGKSKETCESVVVAVETGGNYRFRVWMNEELKELYMESTPDDGQEGVTTIQTRSLIDNDLMKMVSYLIHFILILLFYYSFYYFYFLLIIFCSIGGE